MSEVREVREHHNTTALNPRELECKSIDRLRPHSHLPPPRLPSSSSYLPAVVSLRTLPPFVALSRPFWRTREEEGRTRAQPRGNRREERSDSTWRGGERGKIRPPFFSQDSNTDANPSPMQGKGWVLFCFSLLRLFCSLSVSQIVDIPLRPAASERKQLRRGWCMNLRAFYRDIFLSNRIERRWKVTNV